MKTWLTAPLGDVIELAYGKSLPKGMRAVEGKIPVYGSNGITGWHNEPLVNESTIIVGRKGSAGAIQLVQEPCFPIDTTYFVRVRRGFEAETKFLFYLLSRLDLSRLKTATGVPGLNREDAYRELISLPPLPEQHRIVDLLSRAEGIVRLRREAEKKAAELIPALFNDMFGDPATNPKGWPVEALESAAKIISGATKGRRFDPSEAIELPYMRVANVKDGYLDLREIKTIAVKRGEVEKYRLLPGDLLLTEGGDPDKLGRGALWAGEIETCLHQNHIYKVRADRSKMLPEYLCELVGSQYGKAYFLQVAKKTTGIATINRTQLGRFTVVAPPLARQADFGEKLSGIRSIQSQQSTATAKAQATFDALLAHCFAPTVAAGARSLD